MNQHSGYLVDVSSIQLDEGDRTSWIQLFPIGHWSHPTYGDIDITPDRVKRFADNVNNNVRGQQLNIDYDHEGTVAAGWFTKAEARADGVWGQVEWTPKAMQHLKDGEYKYFSPDFMDEWEQTTTGQKFEDVLFGGGLTNRPHLKGILPINLSEVVVSVKPQVPAHPEGGSQMNEAVRKMLAEKLGLAADASEEDVNKALLAKEKEMTFSEPPKNDPPKNEPKDSDPSEIEGLTVGQVKQLKENPAMGPLMKHMEGLGQQLKEQTSTLQLAEVDAQLTRLRETAVKAGYAIPPADLEEMRSSLVAPGMTKQLREMITKPLETMLTSRIKELGERRGGLQVIPGGGGAGNDSDAHKELAARVAKLREADKTMTFTEAMNQVVNDDPALYRDYQREAYVRDADGAIAQG